MMQATYNRSTYTSAKEFIPVMYVNGANSPVWRKYPMVYVKTANYNYLHDKINFIETFANGWKFIPPKNDKERNKQYEMHVFYIKKLNFVIYIPVRYMVVQGTYAVNCSFFDWNNEIKERNFENNFECKCPVMVSLDTNKKIEKEFENLIKEEKIAINQAFIKEQRSNELKRLQAEQDKAIIHEYNTEIKNQFKSELKALFNKFNIKINEDYDDCISSIALAYKGVNVETINENFI